MVEVNPQSKIKTSCKEFKYDLILNLIHLEKIKKHKLNIAYSTNQQTIYRDQRCYNIYVWYMSTNVEFDPVK